MGDAQVIDLFGIENHEAGQEQMFERFWRACPRRVGKGAARKAFERAIKRTTLDVMLAAMQRYTADPERLSKSISFTAHPATWLNQERWDDEVEDLAATMARHPANGTARIPAPKPSCELCDHGFIELPDGSVKRCECSF